MQFARHLIKQKTLVIISVNPPVNTPIKIARNTLVAANVTAKSIRPAKMVKTIPMSIIDMILHAQ